MVSYWVGYDLQLLHFNERPAYQALTSKLCGQASTSHRRMLDVGCGLGFFLKKVRTWYPGIDAYGCDVDPHLLEIASHGGRDRNVVTMFEESSLPFHDQCVDWVTSVVSIGHMAHPVQMLREMKRVLVPGGQITLVVNNRWFDQVNRWTAPKNAPDMVGRDDHVRHQWTPHEFRIFMYSMGYYWIKIEPFGPFPHRRLQYPNLQEWFICQARRGEHDTL